MSQNSAPPRTRKPRTGGKGSGKSPAAVAGRPPSAPRKKPIQKRGEFTVTSIIDAAREILLKQGVEAVTTRRVAERAGVAVGTLYQYFPNRDAILMQLAHRIMSEESSDARPQLFNLYHQSLREFMGALYERTVIIERKLLGLGTDFHQRFARYLQLGSHTETQSMGEAPNSEQLIAAMSKVLRDHPMEATETDQELAAFMIVRGVRNMMATVVEERPDLMNSPSLTPMLIRVVMAIAAGESPPQEEDNPSQPD
ncbi:TetR/AcrR family transcriptional regulator [Denitratisoma oestradiolicum]|uniref:Putative Transcriptional regulator, TetR family protein n=1 Tax=Denitratisoma oestradiolicum TaxID=311182 RepID=A0A6S6XYG5_9PROT|nr:TetR/AcrR family transcriptional regulator [Denitratisoma oestradiolicum]TWO82249.1 hypothetical protein CBW56_02055 [Denitratisoma oestradiolicum]CAB1369199.1 putative Transcriptional regulator, TetR family protein [Denitratisoma oestradiolicum]